MKPFLMGIAGPSCAGKGELAHCLSARLPAAVLDLDGYYREQAHIEFEQRCQVNYDVPSALDVDLLLEHIQAIAAGQTIARPLYDFNQHSRREQTISFRASGYVIVEGLFTLYWPEIRRHLNLSLFIDAPDAVCLERRLARDIRERGRQPSDIKRQFDQQVLPAAIESIRPTSRFADLVLDGCDAVERNAERVMALIAGGRARDL